MLLVGGLVQVLSLKNESRLDDGSMSSVSLSLSQNLLLDNELQQQQRNKFNTKIKNIDDQTSIISLQEQNNNQKGNENEERSFLNTKILYKPYSAAIHNNNNNNNVQSTEFKQTNNNKMPPSSVTKSKTINSTIFKSVTPSITDRVIADLRKEEQLAAEQKERMNGDSVTENINDNDDAIYIDADEDEVNTMQSNSILVENDSDSMVPITDPLATANEKYPVPKLQIQQQKPLQMSNDSKMKGYIPTITIVARDKKSSSKMFVTKTKHFKSFSDDNVSDSDDDDYYDYSGSGDKSIEQSDGESSRDWIIPVVEKIEKQHKRKPDSEPEIKAKFTHKNEYNFVDVNYPVDRVDYDDDGNLQIQQQQISKKIARAHKKQHLLRTNSNKNNNNNDNKKTGEKIKKTRQNHQIGNAMPNKNNNKNSHRKSKEQHYIDEYFSGKRNANTVESLENLNPNAGGWMEPRIRRILGNIKKSEERSQQILLCEGEGELCSMLFKTPNKPVTAP